MRLEILAQLAAHCSRDSRGGCCVSDVESHIDLSQPTVSKHLKALCEGGILERQREGNRTMYRFSDGEVFAALQHFLEFYRSCCPPAEQD